MTLTAQQEKEWNRCMLLGLIQALYQTCQLTDAQVEALLTEHRFLQKSPLQSDRDLKAHCLQSSAGLI